MRDGKENREKKMATRNPGARLAPGFHAAIFPRGLFTVSFQGLSDRGTTRSQQKKCDEKLKRKTTFMTTTLVTIELSEDSVPIKI